MNIQGSSGNIGIGTASPNVPLHVARAGHNVTGNLTLLTTFTDPTDIKGILLGYNQSSQAGIIYSENNTGVGSPLEFWTYNGSSFAPRMTFTQGGNLLINQTNQMNSAYKLDVNGSARVNEIVVNTTGADIVFRSTYKLPKLTKLKSYINKNHHLPEIASAEEMQKDGLALGEMNTKILQKVEELTLYLIDKDKQLSDQNVKIAVQQKEIDQLKRQQINNKEQNARVAALEKALSKLTSNSKD